MTTSFRPSPENKAFLESVPNKNEVINNALDIVRTSDYGNDAEMSNLNKDIAKLKLQTMKHDLKRRLEFEPIRDRMEQESHTMKKEMHGIDLRYKAAKTKWAELQNETLEQSRMPTRTLIDPAILPEPKKEKNLED